MLEDDVMFLFAFYRYLLHQSGHSVGYFLSEQDIIVIYFYNVIQGAILDSCIIFKYCHFFLMFNNQEKVSLARK